MTAALLDHSPFHATEPPLPAPRAPSAVSAMLGAMLDEVDYPMLLVSAVLGVAYSNKAGRRRLTDTRVFCPTEGGLRLRDAADHAALSRAVAAACQQGLRTMLQVSDAGGRSEGASSIAVIPVQHGTGSPWALLTLAKPALCEQLSVQGFGRAHGLTASELRVLDALCTGRSPRAVASERGVLLSTVRTQITSLRAKCGARDIRELLRRVAELPPLVNVLQAA